MKYRRPPTGAYRVRCGFLLQKKKAWNNRRQEYETRWLVFTYWREMYDEVGAMYANCNGWLALNWINRDEYNKMSEWHWYKPKAGQSESGTDIYLVDQTESGWHK